MVPPEQKAALQKASAAAFAPGGTGYVAATEDEKAIEAMLLGTLKKGFDSHDVGVIEPILAPDFEYRYSVAPGKMVVGSRDEYVKIRSAWEKETRTGRSADYALNSIQVNANEKMAVATAFVTYRSRHFHPRFLESYLFEKVGGSWLLKQQVAQVIHPAKPEMHDAEVIMTTPIDRPEVKEIFALLANQQPETAIARLKAKQVIENPVLADRKQGMSVSFFTIFKEPPRVGAGVRTPLNLYEWSKENPGRLRYIPITVTVPSTNPYVVMSGSAEFASPWFRGFWVDVVVDDRTIATKTF